MCFILLQQILQNLSNKIPSKLPLSCADQGVKLPFLSINNMHSLGRKWQLFKSSFYTKMISAQKYNFLVHQNIFFCLIKVSLPTYKAMGYRDGRSTSSLRTHSGHDNRGYVVHIQVCICGVYIPREGSLVNRLR